MSARKKPQKPRQPTAREKRAAKLWDAMMPMSQVVQQVRECVDSAQEITIEGTDLLFAVRALQNARRKLQELDGLLFEHTRVAYLGSRKAKASTGGTS